MNVRVRHFPRFTLCVLVIASAASWVAADEASVSPSNILKQFCLECHNDEVQEAGIRLDTLVDFVKPSDGDTLEKVLQALSSGEMPPEDADRPSPQEQSILEAWVRRQLPLLRETVRLQRPTSNRRLTVEEYSFTMQELFGVDARFDDFLPDDAIAPSGFRNASQLLGLTTLQVEAYLASARRAVDRYVRFGSMQVDPLRYHIELEDLFYSTNKRYETLERAPQPLEADTFTRGSAASKTSLPVYVDPLGPSLPGAHSDDEAFRPAIPKLNEHFVAFPQRLEIGELIVRIRAAGTPDRDGRFPRMRVQAGISLGDGCSVDKRVLSETDVTASLNAPNTYQFRIRLEDVPTKGPLHNDESFDRLSVFDMDHVYISNVSPDPRAIFGLGRGSYAGPSAGSAGTADAIKKMVKAEVNFLHLESIEIEMLPGVGASNSLYRWTLPGIDALDATSDQESIAADALGRFMTAAFRRPITSAELDNKLDLFRKLRTQGLSFEEGLRETMASVLVSPSFLYSQFAAPNAKEPESIQPYQLASRLSYLLWCSPPDEGLLACASDRTLLESDVLRRETTRLLNDPRSRRFLESFCQQWLRLDKHTTVAVDRKVYATYDDDLAADAVRESFEYFVEVFDSNASALDLIVSDYATLNDRLAQHYGIAGVNSGQFRRVQLPADSVRGGLLTQASVLTMNSDGVDSHPIRRGVWLLDRLLNDPPPPPPPQVPQLDETAPDFRGLSLKERIELHRQSSSCLGCHQGIDPWGIVFENFDAIGRWRDHIESRHKDAKPPQPLDASATLPDGSHVTDIVELKRYLREQRAEQFADALVHHLLTYTLGRVPDFADESEVVQIRNRFAASEYRLQELMLAIVESPLFQARTSSHNQNE